jgi:hypothetical protein
MKTVLNLSVIQTTIMNYMLNRQVVIPHPREVWRIAEAKAIPYSEKCTALLKQAAIP